MPTMHHCINGYDKKIDFRAKLSSFSHSRNVTVNYFNFTNSDTKNPANGNTIHLSLLPDRERFRYKNIFASQVILPEALRVVLRWGCSDKLPHETFLEYLEKKKHLSVTNLRKRFGLSKHNIDQLIAEHSCAAFDTTMLYSLIQAACPGMADRNSQVWSEDDDQRLECLVRKAKDLRNEVCHGVANDATSPTVFNSMRDTTHRLITLAGHFYKQPQPAIDNQLTVLYRMVDTMSLTEKEVRLIETQCKFKREAHAESKVYWEHFCSKDTIPFSNEQVIRENVYHPMELYIKIASVKTDSESHFRILSYKELLEPWFPEDDACITILLGEAGAGKSTVIKNIVQQFFNLVKREIEFHDQFHLIHFLECRDRQTKSLEDFLRNNFPETCKKLNMSDVKESFPSLRNLIFVDGIDELNCSSIQAVMEIIQRLRTMHCSKVIFTSRPHAAKEIKEMLDDANLTYRVCEMAEITELTQQVTFLERYATANSNTVQRSFDMADTFRQFSGPVRRFFIYPINLVLFFHLYNDSPKKVKFWNNDGDVTQQILYQYRTVIDRKIKEKGIHNRELLIDEIFDEVSDFAFECLDHGKICLTEEEFSEIVKRSGRILKRYGATTLVDSKQILSVCFLTKSSPYGRGKVLYQFFHKSVQEMFACKSLVPALREQKNRSTTDIINSKLGEVDRDLRRFEKTFVFCLAHLTSSCERKLDKSRVSELVSLLQAPADHHGSNFRYWTNLLHCCANHSLVAGCVTNHIRANLWDIESPERIASAVVLLPLLRADQHPEQMDVSLPASTPTTSAALEDLARVIVQTQYKGKLGLLLHHSMEQSVPCDAVLEQLSSAKCRLVRLTGCLEGETSQRILASLTVTGALLDLCLLRPLDHHLQLLLGGQMGLPLSVTVHYPHCPAAPSPLRRPLPSPAHGASNSPKLKLVSVPPEGASWTVSILRALAPSCGRYCTVVLERCGLSDTDLTKIVTELEEAGIVTTSGAIRLKGNYRRASHHALYNVTKTRSQNHTRDVELFLKHSGFRIFFSGKI